MVTVIAILAFWIHLFAPSKLSFLAHLPGSNKCSALVALPKKPNMDPHAGWICKDFECERKMVVTDCISQTAFQKILDWIVAKVPTILQWKWQNTNASSVLDETMFKTRTTAWSGYSITHPPSQTIIGGRSHKTTYLQNPTETEPWQENTWFF